MFEKSADLYPVKRKSIFLGHCAISPLYKGAATAMQKFIHDMSDAGISALPNYLEVMPRFHKNVAQFLKTSPDNISYVHNSAEAFSLIANGYPFSPGDEIISYMHEYPSNHYPWVLQKRRGVKLNLLDDHRIFPHNGDMTRPMAWSMEELDQKITEKTRIVAISHVQFSSGFAADLAELGALCKERNVDLVVDCAQSLGCLPVYPEEFGIAAVASSGWKWLMGPKGSGILYTAPEFREKLVETMAGPGLMRQGLDYLDLSWAPHQDGRKFEYSTLPWDHVSALNAVLEEVFFSSSIENIRDEIFRLQDIFLENLDQDIVQVLRFPTKNRSGILTVGPYSKSKEMVLALAQKGLIITAPVGYLRFAPHFYNDDEQMRTAAEHVNATLAEYAS